MEARRLLLAWVLSAVFVIGAFSCLANPVSAFAGSVFFQNSSGVSVDNYVPPATMYIRLIGSGGNLYGSYFEYTLKNPSGQIVDTADYAVVDLYTTETYDLSTSAPTGTWTATLRFWDDYSVRWYTLAIDSVYVGPVTLPNIVANTPGTTPSPAVNTHAMTISYSVTTSSEPFTQTVTTQLLINDVVKKTTSFSGSSGSNTYSYQYSTTASYGMIVKVVTDVHNNVTESFENDNINTRSPTVIAEGTVTISGASYPVPSTMSISVSRYHGDSAEGKFRLWLRDSAGTLKSAVEWFDADGTSVVYYNVVSGDPGGYWEATLYWYRFADGSTYELSSDRTWVEGITILSPSGHVAIPLDSYSYPSTISTYVEGWDGDGTEGKYVFNLKDPSGVVKKTQQWTSSSTNYAFGGSVDYTLLSTSLIGLWIGELTWYRYSTGVSYLLTSDVTVVAYTGVPTLAYPANGATEIPTPTTLTWTAPTDANYFEISISTGIGAVYYHSTTTSITLPLSSYTTYYWQVRASPNDGIMYGPWTATWWFKTKTAAGVGGFVTDGKDGSPIGGATVWIEGTTSNTVSDLTGRYWIPWTTAGTFTVWASKDGFTDISSGFTSTGTTTHTVGLSMTHLAGFYGWVRDDENMGSSGMTVSYFYFYVKMPGGLELRWGTSTTTDSWGYYWIESGDLKSRHYYFSEVSSPDTWTCTRDAKYWKTGNVIKQDFWYLPDLTVRTPVAEIFLTTEYATTRNQMSVSLGSGGTHSVSASWAGSGFTYSEDWSTIVTIPAHDEGSFVLMRDIVLTGTYDMTAAEVEEVRVRLWTNTYNADYSILESSFSVSDPNYAGIDTNVDGIDGGKGGYYGNIEGNMTLWVNPIVMGEMQSSSLTFSLGLTVSVGVPGVSVTLSSAVSWGDSSSCGISVQVWNTDTYAHDYKWYLEGASLYGGVALHVWDMGRTQ